MMTISPYSPGVDAILRPSTILYLLEAWLCSEPEVLEGNRVKEGLYILLELNSLTQSMTLIIKHLH